MNLKVLSILLTVVAILVTASVPVAAIRKDSEAIRKWDTIVIAVLFGAGLALVGRSVAMKIPNGRAIPENELSRGVLYFVNNRFDLGLEGVICEIGRAEGDSGDLFMVLFNRGSLPDDFEQGNSFIYLDKVTEYWRRRSESCPLMHGERLILSQRARS